MAEWGVRVQGWGAYWLASMLALAMVLGPTLGQMHRAVHAAGLAPAAAAAPGISHAAHGAAADNSNCDGLVAPSLLAEQGAAPADCPTGNWVHALFAGHGPAECQLLDEASHGYAGPPAVAHFDAVAPESALPAPHLPRPRAIFVAASFDARAPPASPVPRA